MNRWMTTDDMELVRQYAASQSESSVNSAGLRPRSRATTQAAAACAMGSSGLGSTKSITLGLEGIVGLRLHPMSAKVGAAAVDTLGRKRLDRVLGNAEQPGYLLLG